MKKRPKWFCSLPNFWMKIFFPSFSFCCPFCARPLNCRKTFGKLREVKRKKTFFFVSQPGPIKSSEKKRKKKFVRLHVVLGGFIYLFFLGGGREGRIFLSNRVFKDGTLQEIPHHFFRGVCVCVMMEGTTSKKKYPCS